MNFRPAKKEVCIKYESDYQHRLLLYKDPPVEEISLEEFELYAVDRLKMLREVENINIRFKKGSEEYKTKIHGIIKQFAPNLYLESPESAKFVVKKDFESAAKEIVSKQTACRRKDYISHFILRLAFSRSEDLRRWFLTQEMDLFRYRFQELVEANKVDDFLQKNNLKFDPISENVLKPLYENLKNCMILKESEKETGQFQNINFYKVPFTDVLDLVRNRRVYLRQGYAYVPQQELVSIIIGSYRTQMSQALAVTSRKLPYLEEDTRLLPMLKNLSSAYIGDSYTTKKTIDNEKLSLNEVDEASKISFPICMRNLHEGVRRDHHLKHFGRLQYGLFLKAAGLSLEEALIFWRTEFTKTMDVDKFEKQYAYNVRHSYGKEGKRTDYTPYSCLRIITSNQPGPGDFHGCPFKHSDVDVLQKRLQMYKVPNDSISEIVDLVKYQHFQVACARYFEVTHKLSEGTVSINHPNEYFHESRRTSKSGAKSSMSSKVKKEIKQEIKAEVNSPSIEIDVNMDDEMEVL